MRKPHGNSEEQGGSPPTDQQGSKHVEVRALTRSRWAEFGWLFGKDWKDYHENRNKVEFADPTGLRFKTEVE
jgi:hypothetical protein